MAFEKISLDLLVVGLIPVEFGLFVYWLWMYPIRNGLLAARRSGRSKHWLWLAIHPMFGWPVYWFLRRGTYITPVGVDTLSQRTRLLLLLAMSGTLIVGFVVTGIQGLHPLQVLALGLIWVAASGLVMRPLILHPAAAGGAKRLVAVAWIAMPLLFGASAIWFARDEAGAAAKVGAVVGFVLFLLAIGSGTKQQRTLYYRGGVLVGQTPWRDIGTFTRVPGGCVAALVMPFLGAIAGVCVQGARTLGLW
jgi:hypothetical protein